MLADATVLDHNRWMFGRIAVAHRYRQPASQRSELAAALPVGHELQMPGWNFEERFYCLPRRLEIGATRMLHLLLNQRVNAVSNLLDKGVPWSCRRVDLGIVANILSAEL